MDIKNGNNKFYGVFGIFFLIYVPGIFSHCANNERQGPAQHNLCKS